MSKYDTSELHRRQNLSGVGQASQSLVERPTTARRRGMLVPLAVLGLGILLSVWGPLPGLGLILTLGAVMGLVLSALLLLTDGLS